MSANPPVVIVKEQNVIYVQSAFPIMPKYQNFSALATINGQTIFTLPSYPVLTGLISVNINGVTQDPLNGDYTVYGNLITVNYALTVGDKVSGFYQVLSSQAPPTIGGYATFFFTASLGQQTFNIGFPFSGVIYVSVNGTLQAIGEGDYSINGQFITMSQPLNAGDKFFGLVVI